MSRTRRLALGVAGVVAFLALLEAVIAVGLVSARFVPPPSTVLPRFVDLLGDGDFLRAVLDTLRAWALAIVAATAVAVPLGILVGSVPALYRATSAVIELLRPIPSVALLPVAILLFGLGTDLKVILGGYAIFWPLLLNTSYGVGNVDRVMLYTARSFRWSHLTVMRRVTLPAAVPYVATGLRIAAAVCLIVVLTCEILAARSGLGTVIREYQEADRRDFVYAGILAVGLLGLVLNALVAAVERRALSWAPGYRG